MIIHNMSWGLMIFWHEYSSAKEQCVELEKENIEGQLILLKLRMYHCRKQDQARADWEANGIASVSSSEIESWDL